MYERYLAAFKNGVKDIDIRVDEDEFWTTGMDRTDPEFDTVASAATVTVTFAVFTDGTAWITIDGNGFVYPAFGGTGTSKHELDEYAEQAVSIWRAVTGDDDTTCRYKIPEDDRHDRDQDDPEHIINA